MPHAPEKISVARFIHLTGLTITVRGENVTIRNGGRSLRCTITGATTGPDALAHLADLALREPSHPTIDRLYALLGDDLYGQLLYETEAS